MEISLFIKLFAFVISIQSTCGLSSTKGDVASSDDSSEESSEDNARFPFPEPNRTNLIEAQQIAVKMTSEDLKRTGYPQNGIPFTSSAEEENYFRNKYPHSTAERKCYQYQNDILRQRFNREDETGDNIGIINGFNASINNYPYMGALGYKVIPSKLTFLCGCTLISHHFALTAAHCASKSIDNELKKATIVRFGTTNIEEPGLDYDINCTIQYDKYKSLLKDKKQRYDIALVHVLEKIMFNEVVQPACLWRTADTSSLKNVFVCGWGVTHPDGTQPSSILQVAMLKIVDTKTCKEIYNNSGQINKRIAKEQICASELGVDSCQGDSGGPLAAISNNIKFIVGIVSYGYGCALGNVPGIYTRVSSYVGWIEQNVWSDDSE